MVYPFCTSCTTKLFNSCCASRYIHKETYGIGALTIAYAHNVLMFSLSNCSLSHDRPVNADNGNFSKLKYSSEPFQVTPSTFAGSYRWRLVAIRFLGLRRQHLSEIMVGPLPRASLEKRRVSLEDKNSASDFCFNAVC